MDQQQRIYAEIPRLSTLLPAEARALVSLRDRHLAARAEKDFVIADELRAELMAWGAWPPDGTWNPVAEEPVHRLARLEVRIAQ